MMSGQAENVYGAVVGADALANGLRYVLCRDTRLPIAAVSVLYRVGARDDPAGQTGLAHLMEHMMFQGSARVRPNEHIQYIRDAGGTANGDTTLELTSFTQSFPSSQLEPVLWLEADRMAGIGDSITEKNFETQRAVVIQERHHRYDNQPAALEWEQAMSHSYPEGHPYRHMPAGRGPDLRRVRISDAIRFARQHYTVGNAVLAVVGDIEPERCAQWISRYFGGLAPSAPQPRHPVIDVNAPMPAPSFRAGSAERALSVFRLPPGSAGSYAQLAATALNAGLRNRLASVPGRSQVGYATLSTIDLDTWPSPALLEVEAAPGAQAEAAADVVDQVLGRYALAGPGLDETRLGQHAIMRRWMKAISTVEGKAVDLARSAALLGGPLRRAELMLRTDQPGPGAVREAAVYLHPDRCARTVISAESVSAEGM